MTDGEGIPGTPEIAVYLSRLTGRPVNDQDWVSLSSSQRARAAGWLRERGIAPADLRDLLSRRFQPAMLGQPAMPGKVEPDRHRDRAPTRTASARAESTSDPLQVGIDIQRVGELVPTEFHDDLKASPELAGIFTLRELSYAQSRLDPGETLTGIFAAKEALRKCDGTLLAKPLKDLEILPDERGRPAFSGFGLSISHSGGFAIAVAARLAQSGRPPFAPSAGESGRLAAHSSERGRKSLDFRSVAPIAATVFVLGLLLGALLAVFWR